MAFQRPKILGRDCVDNLVTKFCLSCPLGQVLRGKKKRKQVVIVLFVLVLYFVKGNNYLHITEGKTRTQKKKISSPRLLGN